MGTNIKVKAGSFIEAKRDRNAAKKKRLLLFLTFIGFCAGCAVATQIDAHLLKYAPSLGKGYKLDEGIVLYAPYSCFVWLGKLITRYGLESPTVTQLFFATVFSIVLCTFLPAAVMKKKEKARIERQKAESIHGNAHWADMDEIRDMSLLPQKPTDVNTGAIVGGVLDEKTGVISYLMQDGPEHILAYAPTRSGKGVGLVLPTLLSWEHSCIVLDIKGENYALTSGWRRNEANNYVLKFDPLDTTGMTARYNPMNEIGIDDSISGFTQADVENLANLLADPTGKGSEGENAHWVNTSSSLLICLIFHLLFKCKAAGTEPTLTDLRFMFASFDDGEAADAKDPVEALKLAVDDIRLAATYKAAKSIAEEALSNITEDKKSDKIIGYAMPYLMTFVEIDSGDDQEDLVAVQEAATTLSGNIAQMMAEKAQKNGGQKSESEKAAAEFKEKVLKEIMSYEHNPNVPDEEIKRYSAAELKQMCSTKDARGFKKVPELYKWRDGAGKVFYTRFNFGVKQDGSPIRTHRTAASNAREAFQRGDKESATVLSTASNALRLFSDPILAANLRNATFRLNDLMNADRPVSLYLCVPPAQLGRIIPIMRIMVTQVVQILAARMRFVLGRSEGFYHHRLLLLLDEFPTLGNLEVFEGSIAFIAGYGLKSYLIIQDLKQLYKRYSDKESIQSNCHVQIMYAPNNKETAETISAMLGNQTLLVESTSTSVSKGVTTTSKSLQAQSKPLMAPNEIMALPGPVKNEKGDITMPGKMIVKVAGFPPIYGTQSLYFLDEQFAERAKMPEVEFSDILMFDLKRSYYRPAYKWLTKEEIEANKAEDNESVPKVRKEIMAYIKAVRRKNEEQEEQVEIAPAAPDKAVEENKIEDGEADKGAKTEEGERSAVTSLTKNTEQSEAEGE